MNLLVYVESCWLAGWCKGMPSGGAISCSSTSWFGISGILPHEQSLARVDGLLITMDASRRSRTQSHKAKRRQHRTIQPIQITGGSAGEQRSSGPQKYGPFPDSAGLEIVIFGQTAFAPMRGVEHCLSRSHFHCGKMACSRRSLV